MSNSDDYSDDMSGVDNISAGPGRPAGQNSDTAAVTRFLADLRSLGEAPAPPPTRELEAIFAGATPLRSRRRYGRIARRAILIAAAVVAALVAAAANHTLPAPAQRVVSNVVNSVTPFHIGGPPGNTPMPSSPTKHPTSRPSRTERSDEGGRSGLSEAPDTAPEPSSDSAAGPAGAESDGGDGSAAGGGEGESAPSASRSVAAEPDGNGQMQGANVSGDGGGERGGRSSGGERGGAAGAGSHDN